MLDCYLLMVISSHHEVTVERDEQRGKNCQAFTVNTLCFWKRCQKFNC